VPESCRLPSESPDEAIRRALAFKTIAVVGCSPKPERAGHYVPAYMQSRGYKIVPVNPGHDEILGEKCYASLSEIPFPIELVNVFRRPEDVPPVIDEAIRIKAKAVWLQSGITHPEAEERARKAGLLVVSDECLMVRHRQLGGR
jgi:predicted CoA-binding protein